MTENDAIKEFIRMVGKIGEVMGTKCGMPEKGSEIFKMSQTVMDSLKEYQQYRAIGTLKECRNAMEKMKTKKAEKWNGEFLLLKCPECQGLVFMEELHGNCYCTHCGQRIGRE